jgi:hypothetical protein
MPLSKRAVSRVVFTLLASLIMVTGTQSQTTSSPRVFYSDLESGPSTGGQNSQGAFVTIYGKGFGATRGSSVVTVGGIAAHAYLTWSDTRIGFQLSSSAVTGNITVTVAGVNSTGVPFTVRPGHIHFVSNTGSDAQRGSFSKPWQTLAKAKASAAPGDIVYLMNGFSATAQDSLNASLAITRAGSSGNPIALVAYPGATATIGSATGQTYGVIAPSGDFGYWVLAGLTLRGANEAIDVTGTSNWRLVGNDISCPNGSGTGACVNTSSTSQVKFLGNNVHDTGSATGSSLVNYESVQFSGANSVEAGWNQIGNARGCRALMFSSSGSSQFGLLVHDNYVHDAVCDGITFANVDPSQGAVMAYNNIIQHVGTGPAPTGGESTYACINVGGSGLGSVQILNNTFYDCGARANADSGGISATTPVVVANNIFALRTGESYVTTNTSTSVLSGSNDLFWGAGAMPAPFGSSVDADPLFIDVANANFHVQPSSPAIDAGTKTGVASDYEGVSRPLGPADDIGAYESAGVAQGAGQLTENPGTLNFGTITIAASSTQSVTVSNSGSASVTISQMNVTGAGFSASGLSLPATLTPGQSASFTVTFAPQATGSVTGSVALLSNAANATSTVQLSGTGGSVPPAPGCTNSTASWQSSSYAAQTGTFTAQWDSTPSASAIAAFAGLSTGAAAAYSDNAAVVRFNIDNTIQALRGGSPDAYAADATMSYTAGSSYHFRLVVSVPSHTYSVYVTPQGGTETLLASNYPFRSTQQTVTGLSFVNTIWDVGSAASLCNFALTPTAGTLSASPAAVSFGSVVVGSSATQNVTVTAAIGSVTISQATASTGFSLSGLTLPTTLAAGQSATFQVKFTPTTTGSVTGSLSLTSNASNSPTAVSLSGTGATQAGTLSASPSAVSFGSIVVGSSATQNVTVTAASGSVTISQATASTSFSLSGLTLPTTLAAGQSATFQVKFAPTTTGSVTGSLSLTSNASNSPTAVSLSGAGATQAGTLSASPSAVSFGSVVVGSSATQNVTITAATGSVTISQSTASTGFSLSGLTLPTTLAAGQSATFQVKFAPTTTGSVTGNLSLTSNASNSPTAIALSGTGASAPAPPGCSNSTASWQSSSYAAQTGTFTAQWDSIPSAQAIAAFAGLSSIAAGAYSDNAAIVRFNIDNTIQALQGGTPDVYTADTSINYTAGSSYHFRLVVSVPGHTYSVFVTPQGGTETLLASNYPFRSTQQSVASLSLVNTIWDVGSGATLCNLGVAATPGTLSASPASVNFGNVVMGSSATQNVTVTASSSSVTISQATATTGFSMSGPTMPMTLAAGQSATFQVKFAPTATGSVTGTFSLTSNASNSPVIALSGTGTTAAAHSTTLNWVASSSSNVVGYYVYRGTQTGGPYTKLNSTAVTGTTYTDSNVTAGTTYFYVVNAVDSNGTESAHSSEVSATIPTP